MSPLTVRENTRTSPLTVVDPDFDQCMQINRYDVIANYRCNDAVCKIFDLRLYLTQYSIWTKQKSIPWWSVWLCIISKSNKIFFANIFYAFLFSCMICDLKQFCVNRWWSKQLEAFLSHFKKSFFRMQVPSSPTPSISKNFNHHRRSGSDTSANIGDLATTCDLYINKGQ